MKDSRNLWEGVGITPPSYTNNLHEPLFEETESYKRAGIDWFTSTFDFIKYDSKPYPVYFEINRHSVNDLSLLFTTLTADKDWTEYDWDRNNSDNISSRNGFKRIITIGQHIKILFFGPKNLAGNHTTMIDLSGEACREFNARGGSWEDLIKLLISWDSKCTRFDLAIDDFSGREVNIYTLWDSHIRNFYYTSPYHQAYPFMVLDNKLMTYKGFGFYLGTRGKNQLLVYDKRLEQQSKGITVYDPIWYRYEMRFMGGKATTIMREYLVNLLSSQEAFNQFAMESLYGCLDIKIPDLNDSNRQRWKTEQFWLDFLNDVKKMKIKNLYKPEQTIEKKIKWVDRSVDRTLAKLYLVDNNFLINRLKAIGKKMYDFSDSDLQEINDYLKNNDQPEINKDDLKKISNNLLGGEELLSDDTDQEESIETFNEDDLPF